MSIGTAVLLLADETNPSRPLLQQQSHALLPLGRSTVLEVMLDELVAAGAERVCIVTGPRGRPIRQTVEAFWHNGTSMGPGGGGGACISSKIDLHWVHSDETGGCVTGLLAARSFLGNQPFMLVPTDAPIYHLGQPASLLQRMSATMEATGADGVVAVREARRSDLLTRTVVEAAGNADTAAHFVVSNFVDRPLPQDTRGGFGLISRYVFSPIVFDYLKEQVTTSGDGSELTPALRRLARDREALWATRMHDRELCFDLSSFLLYTRAFIYFSLRDAEVGTAVHEYLRSIVSD